MEITWTDGFSVGVPLMDEQHKKLIALINATQPPCTTDAALKMFEYAELHFHVEETMLLDKRYPQLPEQLNEHKLFLAKAQSCLTKNIGDPAVCKELNLFLCKWLSHHILEIDMKYKHFLLPAKG